MSEYVSKEYLLKIPDSQWEVDGIDQTIRNAPAADVAPVFHGQWIICVDGYYPYCSRCGREPKDGELTNYCPDCGARMDGKGLC